LVDEVGQADGSKKTLHAGDTSTATKDTTHYHRNLGKDKVVLIAVDIFHPCQITRPFRPTPQSASAEDPA
jgi:hypothetical protein